MIDQLCADLDAVQNELSATKLQLSSKCEAIRIITDRLEESRAETEQFKLMAEQLQERYRTLKKTLGSDSMYSDTLDQCQKQLFLKLKVKLHESEMSNRILETEITKLRRKTAELTDDLAMFRRTAVCQNQFVQKTAEVNSRLNEAHERESLVGQLETKSLECARYRRDLELCQDEKNDLLSELQAYKESHHLGISEQQTKEDPLAVLRDNESLSRQVSQLESENRLLSQTLAKYQDGRRKSAVSLVLRSSPCSDSRLPSSGNSSVEADGASKTTFETCNGESVESLNNLHADFAPKTRTREKTENETVWSTNDHCGQLVSSSHETDNTTAKLGIEQVKGTNETDVNILPLIETSDKPPGGP